MQGVRLGDVDHLCPSILSLPEDLVAVPVTHEVRSSVYQGTCIFLVLSYSRNEFFFAFKDLFSQVRVNESVLDAYLP